MNIQNIESFITTFPIIDRTLDHQKRYTEECLQECANRYTSCTITLKAYNYDRTWHLEPIYNNENNTRIVRSSIVQGTCISLMYDNNVLYGKCEILNWKDNLLARCMILYEKEKRYIQDRYTLELCMTGNMDKNDNITHISSITSGAIISL